MTSLWGILVHFVSKFSPFDMNVILLEKISVVEKTEVEEEEWRSLQYIGRDWGWRDYCCLNMFSPDLRQVFDLCKVVLGCEFVALLFLYMLWNVISMPAINLNPNFSKKEKSSQFSSIYEIFCIKSLSAPNGAGSGPYIHCSISEEVLTKTYKLECC